MKKLFFFGICAIMFLVCSCGDKSNKNNFDLNNFKTLHQGEVYFLEGFPILKQKYYYSCSASTICSIKEYFGDTISEDTLMKQYSIQIGGMGMSPKLMAENLVKALPDFEVTLKQKVSNKDLLELIIYQLKNKIPVPIFYSTIDVGDSTRFGTHYSNVIGIDIDNQEIKIANVYGYLEILSFEKFLGFMAHSHPTVKADWKIQTAEVIGLIKKNTVYILKKSSV